MSDIYFSNVSLLLNMEGSDGSTTITDGSQSQKIISTLGTARIDTSVKKFDTSSLFLDGDSSYCSVAPHVDFSFETGDFTIESWVYLPYESGFDYVAIIDTRDKLSGENGVLLFIDNNRRIGYYFSSEVRSAINVLTIAQWMHVAISRASGITKVFIDGFEVISTIDNDNKTDQNCFIGRLRDVESAYSFSGYIDDFRITKGVARYTSNFTPPASSFLAPQMGMLPGILAGIQSVFETLIGVADNQAFPLFSGGVATAVCEEVIGNGSSLLPALVGVGFSGGIANANLPLLTSTAMAGGAGFAHMPTLMGGGVSGAIGTSLTSGISAGIQSASFPLYSVRQSFPDFVGFGIASEALLNEQVDAGLGWIHGFGCAGVFAISQKIPLFDGIGEGIASLVARQHKPITSITGIGQGIVGMVARQVKKELPSILGGATAGANQAAAFQLPFFTGYAEAVVGVTGQQVAKILPVVVGYADASEEVLGQQIGRALPLFYMPMPIVGGGALPFLRGIGYAASHGSSHAWTIGWAMLAIESYVMGVDATDAAAHPVTRYTNYPFLQVIRLGDSYYGVAPDGLHCIGGSQDNGMSIPWAVQTHVTDFGTQFHKTVASAYLGGLIGPSVTFSTLTGEHSEQMHSHANTFTTQLKNHREKFGKGRKARYWAFGLSSSAANSNLMLDALDLEVFEMSRRGI